MNLLDFYRSILGFASISVDEDGYTHHLLENTSVPVAIKGKQLVLPTPENLKNPHDRIMFHPLSENIVHGESEVIKKYKKAVNVKLNYAFGIIGQWLLQLVGSPAEHEKLTPEQQEVLLKVKDVDNTTIKNFSMLMAVTAKQGGEQTFVHVYLRRGGNYKGRKYSRVGVVAFPFYEELRNDQREIFGVKLRVKDVKAYRELCEFIFPNLDDPEALNYGSSSNIAPYLDSLLRTALNVASRYADIVSVYSDMMEAKEAVTFNTDWVDTFENLEELKRESRLIPMQAGNEGESLVREAPPPTPEPVQAPPPQTWQQQPVKRDPTDWNAIKQSIPLGAQTVAMAPPPQMVQVPPGFAPAAPAYPQPGMPFQQGYPFGQYPQQQQFPQQQFPQQLPPGYQQPFQQGYPQGYPYPQQGGQPGYPQGPVVPYYPPPAYRP